MFETPTTRRELAFPGPLQRGAKGPPVRRLQEWLSLGGFGLSIDGDFGPATQAALNKFKAARSLHANGTLDAAAWGQLTQALDTVLDKPITGSLERALGLAASTHLKARPREVGGENAGPWVRVYTGGHQGRAWPWCAAFVSFVIAQAAAALGTRRPLAGSPSCDVLAAQAQRAGRFVRGADLASGKLSWSELGRISVFLVRRTPTDWTHTGFALDGEGEVFATIEGNTNEGGSPEGFEVCARTRSVAGKDFIRLL